jgi:hypothetical protein
LINRIINFRVPRTWTMNFRVQENAIINFRVPSTKIFWVSKNKFQCSKYKNVSSFQKYDNVV